ncbi:small acid-soluble spore protein K [Aquibacillus salsiterrae]|uniref:Small, acid-soluble spore protein K n=1 Tax=Aquibacillus salsiterrae TaxID=2950439 RepID=A0A9X3WED3_9BACI|nr:small acid-soluble spore protein K [Aquibacillus salsiterrae]MDC3418197.1 small, acid-soluble spore protein K [Aquibacillus salsiterrae]
MVRNKDHGFTDQRIEDMPRARAEFSSLRANGTINTKPQERMKHSNDRFKDNR